MWLAAFKINTPWTLPHQKADHESLKPAAEMPVITYPKPDGIFSFDKLNSINLSNIAHDANQPCHLKLKDSNVPISINLAKYDAPEQRYCPAGVYEIIQKTMRRICKLTRKIAFIAKPAILKIQRRILCGCRQKVVVGLFTRECNRLTATFNFSL